MSERIGFTKVTSDQVVGTTGSPIVVYGMNIISGGGGAGVVILRNGTTVAGTVVIQENGVTGQGKTISYGENGVVFPGGLFCDVDTNVTSVSVLHEGA